MGAALPRRPVIPARAQRESRDLAEAKSGKKVPDNRFAVSGMTGPYSVSGNSCFARYVNSSAERFARAVWSAAAAWPPSMFSK